MLVKLLLQKEFCIILVDHIKLEKCMMVMPLWIGWSKNKSEVSQLLQLLQHVFGLEQRMVRVLINFMAQPKMKLNLDLIL